MAMLKNEALTHIEKVFGTLKGLTYQTTRYNTSPELRAQAQKRYDRLKVRQNKLQEEANTAWEHAQAYRHRMYENQGSFCIEIAKGDTWEEVLTQLKTYKEARASRSPLAASAVAKGGA